MYKVLLHSLLLLFAFIHGIRGQETDVPVCRALALGGGGDRGAYEAGVIRALVEKQSAEKVRYEVVTGISAGAINAAAFSQFKIGDEVAAKDFLVSKWKTTKKEDIYKNWFPGGIVEGFFLKPGLFDHTPLQGYLKDNVDVQKLRNSGRTLVVGAVNIARNEFFTWDQTSPYILEAVRASSSIPGVFPTVEIDGELFCDGGQLYMTPVTSAIERCIQLHGGKPVQVMVDVILAISDSALPQFFKKYNVTPFVLLQSIFGMIQSTFVRDIANAKIAYPNSQIRVFKPEQWLPGMLLFFDNSDKILDIGFEEASKVINSTMWW